MKVCNLPRKYLGIPTLCEPRLIKWISSRIRTIGNSIIVIFISFCSFIFRRGGEAPYSHPIPVKSTKRSESLWNQISFFWMTVEMQRDSVFYFSINHGPVSLGRPRVSNSPSTMCSSEEGCWGTVVGKLKLSTGTAWRNFIGIIIGWALLISSPISISGFLGAQQLMSRDLISLKICFRLMLAGQRRFWGRAYTLRCVPSKLVGVRFWNW